MRIHSVLALIFGQFIFSSILFANDLRPLFDANCSHILDAPFEFTWPEIKSDELLLSNFLKILSKPAEVIEKLKRDEWTQPVESYDPKAGFSSGPLRKEILNCKAKDPKKCGVMVATMGIGYSWSRFQQNREFIEQARRTHHVVYLEMPGQGETYLLRLAYWSMTLSEAERRVYIKWAERAVELTNKFSQAKVETTKKEASELTDISLKIGRLLFEGKDRDWVRAEYSELKRNYFESIKLIVEKDLNRSIDEIDFVGLSWGGWFLSAALNQDPPFRGQSLTLLDPGFGWLGTLLNPLYKNFDASLRGLHNAVDLIQNGIDQFFGFFVGPVKRVGGWLNAANIIDDQALRAEAPEVNSLLAKHSRDYLLDPVARAGAVAMTFILREQNTIETIADMPIDYKMTLVQSPDGLFLPPKYQAVFATQFLLSNGPRRALWISGAPHDLPTASSQVQKWIFEAQDLAPGFYLVGDSIDKPKLLDSEEWRNVTEKSQLNWEQLMLKP